MSRHRSARRKGFDPDWDRIVEEYRVATDNPRAVTPVRETALQLGLPVAVLFRLWDSRVVTAVNRPRDDGRDCRHIPVHEVAALATLSGARVFALVETGSRWLEERNAERRAIDEILAKRSRKPATSTSVDEINELLALGAAPEYAPAQSTSNNIN